MRLLKVLKKKVLCLIDLVKKMGKINPTSLCLSALESLICLSICDLCSIINVRS